MGDSVIPGYGNPAASLTVKFYLTAVKEEQLLARTVPIQVEPFLIQDLAATSFEILKRLSGRISSPTQLFILARDQAPIVQTSDSAIHRINHYPADRVMISVILIRWIVIYLAPVVQTLVSAIHRINHYPEDSVINFRNPYPLDSYLSGG